MNTLRRVGDDAGPTGRGERRRRAPGGARPSGRRARRRGRAAATVASATSSATPRAARPARGVSCAGGRRPASLRGHVARAHDRPRPSDGTRVTGSAHAHHGARRRHRRRPVPARPAAPPRAAHPDGAAPTAEITVVGNTGDDITLFGLRVCPDLDTVMYTLGGGIHEEQGWGRADETFAVKEELAAYGVEPQLVRARRPRHRDPPGAHPDARRGLPALARSPRRCARAGSRACGCCR